MNRKKNHTTSATTQYYLTQYSVSQIVYDKNGGECDGSSVIPRPAVFVA